MNGVKEMDGEYIQSRSTMTIRFGGTDRINSKLFTEFVDNSSYLLGEATKEICPDARMHLDISAVRPGSFVFDFQTVVDVIPLASDVMTIASCAATIFIGAIKLRNHLRGAKPKSIIENGDNVTVRNNNGDITVDKRTYNVFTRPEINIKISNIFFDLSEDGSKTTFEVNHEGESISIPASDFEELAVSEPFENEDSAQVESFESKTQLKIRKAILEGNSRWSFYNGTRAIDAAVTDADFLESVRNGKLSFSKGDRFLATLITEYHVDEYGAPLKGTEKFTVSKIHKVYKFESIADRQTSI